MIRFVLIDNDSFTGRKRPNQIYELKLEDGEDYQMGHSPSSKRLCQGYTHPLDLRHCEYSFLCDYLRSNLY